MSKLLTLKEIVEMDSDEFNKNFLKEQDTVVKVVPEGTTMADLIRLWIEGRIIKAVFVAEARRMGADKVLGAAAVMGAGIKFLVAGALGYGLGVYLRDYVYPDYKGESLERIRKASADTQYALNELDVYCRGLGPLCTRRGGDVRCAKKRTCRS